MTREQRLFAAAQHFRELHPVDDVNWFNKGSKSHTLLQSRQEAQRQLDEALAAYEGKTA